MMIAMMMTAMTRQSYLPEKANIDDMGENHVGSVSFAMSGSTLHSW